MHLLTTGPDNAPTLALAHGAGAAMDSPFMNEVAERFANAGVRVVRFEFPYMAERREGKRRGPDRPAVLVATWMKVIEQLRGGAPLFIGGKSMGGRFATMIADTADVRGTVVFGYPFHPAGDREKTRVEHLARIKTPTLILQGERDALGSREEVSGYDLSPAIEITWLPDGDHSLEPRKSSGHTFEGNLTMAIESAAKFIKRHSG